MTIHIFNGRPDSNDLLDWLRRASLEPYFAECEYAREEILRYREALRTILRGHDEEGNFIASGEMQDIAEEALSRWGVIEEYEDT